MTKIGCIYEDTRSSDLLILIHFDRSGYNFRDKDGKRVDTPKLPYFKQVTAKKRIEQFVSNLKEVGQYDNIKWMIHMSSVSGDGTMKYIGNYSEYSEDGN